MSDESEDQLLLPWISSAVGSLAKTSASQAKARDSKANGRDFGLSIGESSPSSARRSSSSKTCRGCVREDCAECSRTFPVSGSMRSGRVLPPQTSERHISASGSLSLLPTPTASSYGTNRGGSSGRVGRSRPSLQTRAKGGLLPTPSASSGGRTVPPGTTATGIRPDGTKAQIGLNTLARNGLLPTPTVKGNHNKVGLSERSGDGLATAVGGRLSARFVEWMMGFPIDHTDVD